MTFTRDPSRSRVVSIGGGCGGRAREEILASTEVAIDRRLDGGPRARIAEVVDRASASGCGGGLANRLWPIQQDGRQLGDQLVEQLVEQLVDDPANVAARERGRRRVFVD